MEGWLAPRKRHIVKYIRLVVSLFIVTKFCVLDPNEHVSMVNMLRRKSLHPPAMRAERNGASRTVFRTLKEP